MAGGSYSIPADFILETVRDEGIRVRLTTGNWLYINYNGVEIKDRLWNTSGYSFEVEVSGGWPGLMREQGEFFTHPTQAGNGVPVAQESSYYVSECLEIKFHGNNAYTTYYYLPLPGGPTTGTDFILGTVRGEDIRIQITPAEMDGRLYNRTEISYYNQSFIQEMPLDEEYIYDYNIGTGYPSLLAAIGYNENEEIIYTEYLKILTGGYFEPVDAHELPDYYSSECLAVNVYHPSVSKPILKYYFNLPPAGEFKLRGKVGGTWMVASKAFANENGVWKETKKLYGNKSGWKQ